MKVIKYSYRRRLLDECLFKHAELLRGQILDVGGGRGKQRGLFSLTSTKTTILDRFPREHVDIVADAGKIPYQNASFDSVRLTEVLEHVPNPPGVCTDIARILKPGGWLVCSTPFLEPIHGDPDDYWRLTPSAYRHLLTPYFEDVQIIPQGGTVTVILEIIRRWIMHFPIWLRYPSYLLSLPIMELLFYWEVSHLSSSPRHTTGYVCLAKRSKLRFKQ